MSRSRRWRLRMELMQHALRAVEMSNRSRESLDHIVRILAEEDDEAGLSAPPPALSPGPKGEPPSERPTRYQEAMDSGKFARLCRNRFAEATQESQRDAVRALVRRGRESGLLEATDADLLADEFGK